MTSEEIKQQAEEYASIRTLDSTESFHEIVENYLEGAHSRDVEVEMLQNQIEELSEQLKMNAENIQRLRNPWISVEERLPEKKEGIYKIVFYKDERGYIYTGYLNADGCWRDSDRNDTALYKVTHWMPRS